MAKRFHQLSITKGETYEAFQANDSCQERALLDGPAENVLLPDECCTVFTPLQLSILYILEVVNATLVDLPLQSNRFVG